MHSGSHVLASSNTTLFQLPSFPTPIGNPCGADSMLHPCMDSRLRGNDGIVSGTDDPMSSPDTIEA